VIDLFGLSAADVRQRFPEVYQHVLLKVKPERDVNRRAYRKENWWLFGENSPQFREAFNGLRRYIATAETAKFRLFQFLDGGILPDNMLTCIASEEAFLLGCLSSRASVVRTIESGGTLEDRPDIRKQKPSIPSLSPMPRPNSERASAI
jgi:hypothetical protein